MEHITKQKIDLIVQENNLNHPENKPDLYLVKIKSETEEMIHCPEQENEMFDQENSVNQINQTLVLAKWNCCGENTSDTNEQQNTVQHLHIANEIDQPLEIVKMEYNIEDKIYFTEEEIKPNFVPNMNPHFEQLKLDYQTKERLSLIENENDKYNNVVNQRNQSKELIKVDYNIETTTNTNEPNCKSDTYLFKQIDLSLVNLKMDYTEHFNFIPEEGGTCDENNLIDQMHGVIEDTFQCSKCNFQTNLKRKLTNHLQIEHSLSEKKYSKINQKCDSVCASKNIFSCMKCANKTTLNMHLKSHLENEFRNKSTECNSENQLCNDSVFYKFICTQCDYKTNDRSNFKRHSNKHSGKKQFNCTKCHYQSNEKAYLKLHTSKHSGDYKFHCINCDYKTNRSYNFKSHTYKHSEVKQFNCTQCHYKTNQKLNLKRHISKHSVEKQLNCTQCDYKTNQMLNLKLHASKHSGNYKFHCTICNFKTNYSSHFKSHTSNHSEEKQFNCTKCDYKTNRSSDFNRHANKHSREKVFNCSECDYKTTGIYKLKVHMINHSAKYKLHWTE